MTMLRFALESSALWSMVNLNFSASFWISVTVMQKTCVGIPVAEHNQMKIQRIISLLLASYISTYNFTHTITRKIIQCHDTKFCETSIKLPL